MPAGGGRALAALALWALVALWSFWGWWGAAAQEAEEPEASENDSFWSDISHPHRARYGELVQQAAGLLQANDPTAAAGLLDQAVKLDPGEPLGFYLLGLARLRQEKYNACADALAVVEHLRPGYVPAGTRFDPSAIGAMLGGCYMHAGRFDEAALHYRRMLGTGEPGLPADAIHGNLGDCYQALGRLDEAIEEYALAAAAAPKNAAPLFGLAVALDRDEQVTRSHDAMTRALALDAQLSALSSSGNYFFAPAEDAHYYLGLAHQMASGSDPVRRMAAISRFRRYLSATGMGPWAKRARAHLAELGPPTIGAGDVLVSPVDAPEREAAIRGVVAVGAELQRCMNDDREGWIRAALRLYPAKIALPTAPAPVPHPTPPGLMRPLAAAPEVDRISTVTPDGGVSRQTVDCIEKTLRTIKLPVRQLTLIQVAVIARSP